MFPLHACRFACVCGSSLLCCDSTLSRGFSSSLPHPPSMEGPRDESRDGDGTVVSALVGLPNSVLGDSAQSSATLSHPPGCEQPGVPTSLSSITAGCAPSVYHPARASGSSTSTALRSPRSRSPPSRRASAPTCSSSTQPSARSTRPPSTVRSRTTTQLDPIEGSPPHALHVAIYDLLVVTFKDNDDILIQMTTHCIALGPYYAPSASSTSSTATTPRA